MAQKGSDDISVMYIYLNIRSLIAQNTTLTASVLFSMPNKYSCYIVGALYYRGSHTLRKICVLPNVLCVGREYVNS